MLLGQSAITTSPPEIIAAAINGAAFDRSGSIIKSWPINSPGSTRHSLLPSLLILLSTRAPNFFSISIVISICGNDGSETPISFIVIPICVAGPIRSSAEINWLEAEASISKSPPFIWPLPLIVNGNEYLFPCSIVTPSSSSALITGPTGRSCDLASPSK